MKSEYIDQFRDCYTEFRSIETFVTSNPLDSKNRFLQSYLVMRCCGLIEFVFKALVYDKITCSSTPQIQKFFETTILKNPSNPSPGKITDILNRFDSSWGNAFESAFAKGTKPYSDLKSLVDIRNSIAHGTPITIPSVSDIKDKFISACRVIHFLSILLA